MEERYNGRNYETMLDGKHYLLLICRGNDISKNDPRYDKTDLHNHRLTTEVECGDGAHVYYEFCHAPRYRYYSLRGHRQLKHPVYIDDLRLSVATYCYTNNGYCVGYRTAAINDLINRRGLMFSKYDILNLVNLHAAKPFDDIIVAWRPDWDDLGNREREIVEKLDKVELVMKNQDYCVVRFWSTDDKSFDVEENSGRITG